MLFCFRLRDASITRIFWTLETALNKLLTAGMMPGKGKSRPQVKSSQPQAIVSMNFVVNIYFILFILFYVIIIIVHTLKR